MSFTLRRVAARSIDIQTDVPPVPPLTLGILAKSLTVFRISASRLVGVVIMSQSASSWSIGTRTGLFSPVNAPASAKRNGQIQILL